MLLTSPLPRAHETAEIAAQAFKRLGPGIAPALADQSVEGVVAALETHPRDATVALSGHEPVLGALLAQMLGSGQAARLAFKKGGAALVDLPRGPTAPGRLIWFLDPRVLRTLAEPNRGVTRTSPAANGHALRKESSS